MKVSDEVGPVPIYQPEQTNRCALAEEPIPCPGGCAGERLWPVAGDLWETLECIRCGLRFRVVERRE